MTIDVATIILLITIGNLFTGLFLFAYVFKKQDTLHKVLFIIAKMFQSVAWTLFMLQPMLPAWIVQIFANTSMFVGLFFEAWAIISLHDEFKGWIRNLYTGFIIASVLFFLSIVLFWNTEPRRIFFFSLIGTLLLIGPPITILRRKQRTSLEAFFAIIYVTVIVIMMFRGINAFFGWVDLTVLSTSPINQLMYTLLFAHMIVTNIGFILMSKEKTDAVLLELAHIDQLTQINNRATFLDISTTCINKARESNQPVSLLMFDIDNFKTVNDTHGHMAGDQVLTQISNLLKPLMSGCQTIGRFGGDEFAVILPGSGEKEAEAKAEEIINLVKREKFTEHGLTLAVSIGIVTLIPDAKTDFDTYYRLADEGLYMAKKSNKSAWKRASVESIGKV